MQRAPSRTLRHLPLLLPLVVAACGGSHAEPRTAADVVRETPPPPPPVDTSPVPPPSGLLGKVRVGRLHPMLARVDALLGFGGAIENSAPAMLGEMLDSPTLAGLVDVEASVDLAFVHLPDEAEDDAELAFSFASPAPAEACRRLERSEDVRCVTGANGAFAIERGSMGTATGSGRMRCALFPTADANAGRLVCSERSEALGAVGPFLSRTLARVPADDYVIDAEAAVAEIRARYGARMHEQIEEARAQMTRQVQEAQSGPVARPEVKEAILRIGNELLDNANTVVDEADRYGLRIQVDEDRVHLAYGGHIANPTGTLVRAYRDSLRPTSSVPAELYAHLPANALVYAGAASDARPFQAFVDSLVELGHRLLAASGALPAADVEALRTALANALRLRESAGVGSAAYDSRGAMVVVGVTRLPDENAALEVVGALKTLVTTLRRPAIKRALDQLLAEANAAHPLHVADFRDMPTRGLPRGSFGLRTPTLDALVQGLGLDRNVAEAAAVATAEVAATPPAHRGRPAPAPVAEVLYVPQGRDVYMIASRDARAAFQAALASTTAPIDPGTFASDEAVMAIAVFPGNYRVQTGEGTSASLGSQLGSDVANARVDLRLLGVDPAGGARFEMEMVLDRASLSAVKAVVTTMMAAFASAAEAPVEEPGTSEESGQD
ncbi:MAG: hypothetical protein U0230_21095 [Polyangiales bacterium]